MTKEALIVCPSPSSYALMSWAGPQSNSSVPVSFANSLSSIAPLFSFFSSRYSRANSSWSSTDWIARLCLAVFFLVMVAVAAAFGALLGFLGFGSCCFASFFACKFFFLCFSRDLSLHQQPSFSTSLIWKIKNSYFYHSAGSRQRQKLNLQDKA